MSYSWVPFYREVAGAVLSREHKQGELISLLKEMGQQGLRTIGLTDGGGIEIRGIDPLTFFLSWNRGSEVNRLKICAFLKTKWGLNEKVPSDFDGLPLAIAHESWFSSCQGETKDDDVTVLWRLARAAYDGKPDDMSEKDFKRALLSSFKGVTKLTVGLFWISPKGFLPLDKNTVARAREAGIELASSDLNKKLTLARYRDILAQMHEKFGYDHLKIAHDAYGAAGNIAVEEAVSLPSFPLNRILYGPPGTGKTFNAIPRAVEIITGETFDNRAECQRRFDELRRDGRIGFVTFHQSFSYEEFIEGLRPRLDNDADGSVKYEVRDGVLKEIALRAISASLEKSVAVGATFESLWERLSEKVEDDPDWKMDGIAKKDQYEVQFSGKQVLAKNLAGPGQVIYALNRSLIEKAWRSLGDLDEGAVRSKQVYQVIRVGTHPSVVAAFIRELKRIEKEGDATLDTLLQNSDNSPDAAKSFLTNSPDYHANPQNAPRHVLIIDEINRGNISKILGELITLLEDDKRLGQANELRVTLPVSLETFALPPNLYILGTMNTADKSLALLDIALRRRFEFEEIRPDFSLSDLKLSAEMRGALETLNLRLEAALDREHCLGHAYFKDVETPEQFDAVFRAKIIPLLQEFFYNDWETLRGVLGESGSKGFVRPLKDLKGLKNRTKWRWWFDGNKTEALNCLQTLTGNYTKLGEAESDDDELNE